MKLIIEGDNPDERVEKALNCVGMIFGPNLENGPLRMIPAVLRRLLTADWPKPTLEIALRVPLTLHGKDTTPEQNGPTFTVSMTRVEVYTDKDDKHRGSAVAMDTDSLRALKKWDAACDKR
jgi:hypothetical protein